jgi:hypothetical protein
MKHTIGFLIILGFLVMTACNLPTIKTSWSKPGAQAGEFERAQAECEVDQGITGLGGQSGFDVCMKRKGWFLIEETVQ